MANLRALLFASPYRIPFPRISLSDYFPAVSDTGKRCLLFLILNLAVLQTTTSVVSLQTYRLLFLFPDLSGQLLSDSLDCIGADIFCAVYLSK